MSHSADGIDRPLHEAERLMLEALVLLDKAGANLAACQLQHAIDIVKAAP